MPIDSPEIWSPSESLRLIGRIAHLVSRVPDSDLPNLMVGILEGVREVSGLTQGTISLFDYIFNEVYILEDGSVSKRAPLRAQVSETASRDLPSQGIPLEFNEISLLLGRNSEALFTIPVSVGSQKLGELCILSRDGHITIGQEKEDLLRTFAGLAAIAIERNMRQQDSCRLREWLDAFSKVFAASRVHSSELEIDLLLQEIGNNALAISGADLIVLYEYFEERHDVRLPPTVAGSVMDERVLRGRSVAVEHKRSAVFRLLEMQRPFYAEKAEKWLEERLIDSSPGENSFFVREGVVSSAGIPLTIEKERIGILFVNYRREQSFSPEFCQHLELFASQAALAIGNARFFLRSKRYSRELEALNRIGRELGSAFSRNIEQIGRLIDEQTLQVIPTRNFFLCVYDASRDRFTLPYLRDEYDAREDLEPGLHQGLTGYICRTKQALLATQEEKQRLFAQGVRQVGQPAAVWLGAPLIARDQVIGAIVVQDYEDEAAFTHDHLQLLKAIASQAAIAIENYGLLHDAELRLEELSALLALSQEFSARRLSSTQLLSSILDHLCRLAMCDGSLLLLVYPTDETRLKVAAASNNLQELLGKTMGLSEGLSGQVVRTREPKIINNYAEWPSRCELFTPPPERVCAVPLVWQDEIIGVMTLSSNSTTGKFTRREIEILQRFSGPAAVAVQNARDSSFRNALVDAGPNAIVAVDREGHITEFNNEAAKLFKYSKDEILGESVTKMYWGGFREAIKIQELLLEKGKIKEEEIFGRSKNGEKIPMSIAAALLKDDAGDIMGSVGILEDLRLQSLRGRTQLLVDALRDISDGEDLGRIIESVGDSAITLLYADAGCVFLRKGDAFTMEFCYPREGKNLQTESVQDRLNNFAQADPKRIIFLPEEAKAGELQFLEDSCSSVLVPIQTEARLLGFLLIESRQASHFSADQELLKILASQAAVSINRVQLLRYRDKTQQGLLVSANAIAVGQIATSFIHEAKNSLNGMKLAAQSLSEDINREPSLPSKSEYLDRLDAIQSEVARFDDLSRRLQKFTQQGLRPEKQVTYLNDIVTRTLQLLGSALRSKRIKLEMRLDPSLEQPTKGKGNPVLVDEHQIQQVLMNLILNAIAASPERRTLVLETRNYPDHTEIRIIDQGTGIPREVLRRLFRPFVTTKKDGVGLGLFLSRLLIEENHQGTIEIVNNTPKGTTFSVQFPKSE